MINEPWDYVNYRSASLVEKTNLGNLDIRGVITSQGHHANPPNGRKLYAPAQPVAGGRELVKRQPDSQPLLADLKSCLIIRPGQNCAARAQTNKVVLRLATHTEDSQYLRPNSIRLCDINCNSHHTMAYK